MTRRTLILSLTVASLLAASTVCQAALPEGVKTANGTVSGVRGHDPDVRLFRGIPYAAPPIGDLRWRPPAPGAAWSGVFKADQFGPICPQKAPVQPYSEPQSEDCLTLNIWTKAQTDREKRPVMVWLYGGAFKSGSANTPTYDGENLAEKGVILVSVNFRNGVFGFFAHPDLDKESPQGVSGNYMLLDQIAALRWVKQNIAAFGGDPNNVTIFGQSSGAVSVSSLVHSPLAAGLFQRAIAETGSVFSIPTNPTWAFFRERTLAQAEADGVTLMKNMGLHSVAEMRAKSAAEILNAIPNGPGTYRPVIDGWVLPTDARTMQAAHTFNDVPILVGSNKDESFRPGAPGAPGGPVTVTTYAQDAKNRFGSRADEFLKLLPLNSDADAATDHDVTGTFEWGDYIMGTWARTQAKSGVSKVYLYRFTRNQPVPSSKDHPAPGRAPHGGEIIYAFDNLHVDAWNWTDMDRQLADEISSYWVNFAKNGDPNGPDLPRWPSVQEAPEKMMELGSRVGPMPIAYEPLFHFYDTLGPTPTITKDFPPQNGDPDSVQMNH